MIDWTKSMQQTFEYYTVDPGTWMDDKPIENVVSCDITRDTNSATLGSANLVMEKPLEECYFRAYLVCIQNGYRERFPLGTFIVQTPNSTNNGKKTETSMDAYTPLIELSEVPPPLGFTMPKTVNIMDQTYMMTRDNCRAPVVKPKDDTILHHDFVANTDDTYLTFISEFMANAEFSFSLDDMGRILFQKNTDVNKMNYSWVYRDDDTSIVYDDITIDRDLYHVPNVIEVIYSSGENTLYALVENTDPNHAMSIQNRGRRIVHRDTNPSVVGKVTQTEINEYAQKLLESLNSVECTLTYTHGYCPVTVNDCVLLNCPTFGLNGVKAKVTQQTISCVPGCPVSETAVFETQLWRR